MTQHITRRPLLLGLPLAAAFATYAQAQGTDAQAEDARLLAFLDKAFDEVVALSPEAMTGLGLKTDNDKLNDYTDAARTRMLALYERHLKEMKAQFKAERLTHSGQLSYQLFERTVATARENYRWRWYNFPISTNGTPAGNLPVMLINRHRVDNAQDARAYISRLTQVERVMSEVAANVREQARQGIVPPKMVFTPARGDARAVLAGAPFTSGADTPVFADFKAKVAKLQIADAEKTALVAEASAALTGPFKRGYDTFFAVLDEIEPLAKSNDGAWRLPDGAAYYASRLRFSTTTNLTADQIHQIGLDQVRAIHAEMEALKPRLGFTGSLQELFKHVRTAPELKYPNTDAGREQYLADGRAAIALAMREAPKFFHRLPKAPLEVRAVEKWRQETAAVAFYNAPTLDGTRPGIYYVNLADMNEVQKPQGQAIAFHEGAPGHHFQIALAQELPGVPKFRRTGGYGVYSEGWGLYSERLAKEMGGYQEPYSEFGMLSLQLWRAIRLVVDTGVHHKRWSREQTVSYFRDNSPNSERDINKEVDRYINNPGQATSYMIGQLEIAKLRAKATKALGARFDIRDFHDAVLANGGLPLEVLAQEVDRYIAGKAAV
ncbi:DUF885 domain-containing protein [Caulobacter segnis]|uniref:DUF885 domain-containing protein n=1 Tax=Caulobacter segnis TaxID=88688 RepID=UPI0024102E8D|nr:DUF885 domain-containing protein [Caulobacter segnis]MDG2522532.1 DUF885 domain-containing protein [Caulobacter segnis]